LMQSSVILIAIIPVVLKIDKSHKYANKVKFFKVSDKL